MESHGLLHLYGVYYGIDDYSSVVNTRNLPILQEQMTDMLDIALTTIVATVNPQFDHDAHVRYCQQVRAVAEHIMEGQQFQVPVYMALPTKQLTRNIAIDARNTPIVVKHGKRRAVTTFGDKWQTICHEG
jgi:hypothetical protein